MTTPKEGWPLNYSHYQYRPAASETDRTIVELTAPCYVSGNTPELARQAAWKHYHQSDVYILREGFKELHRWFFDLRPIDDDANTKIVAARKIVNR